jgi:hypothetical protein
MTKPLMMKNAASAKAPTSSFDLGRVDH